MLCPKCRREIPDDSNICCYCGRVIHRLEPRPRKRPNGSGSVYKLTDKRRTRPWVMAKGGKILGRYATKTAALEALEKLAGKPIGDAIDLTLEEIYTLWKAQHYPRLKEDASLAYDLAWSKLEPLAARKMRTLRTEDVQKIIDADVEKGRSRSTVKKVQTLYSQLCQYAMRKDIIDRNYADFLVLPRQKPVQRDTFTEAEIKTLKADADAGNETSMIILILIYTGYRINELLQKRRDQVDLEQGVMYGGEKTAAGRGRVVVINDAILPYVRYFMPRLPARCCCPDTTATCFAIIFPAGIGRPRSSAWGSPERAASSTHTAPATPSLPGPRPPVWTMTPSSEPWVIQILPSPATSTSRMISTASGRRWTS